MILLGRSQQHWYIIYGLHYVRMWRDSSQSYLRKNVAVVISSICEKFVVILVSNWSSDQGKYGPFQMCFLGALFALRRSVSLFLLYVNYFYFFSKQVRWIDQRCSNPWVAPGVALDRDVCPPSCPPQSTSLQLIYNTFTIAPIYNTSSSWTRVWRAFLMSLRHHSLDIYMSQSTMIHKKIHLLLRDPIHPHRSMVLHPHLGGIVFIIMQRPILKRTAYFLQ